MKEISRVEFDIECLNARYANHFWGWMRDFEADNWKRYAFSNSDYPTQRAIYYLLDSDERDQANLGAVYFERAKQEVTADLLAFYNLQRTVLH